MIKAAQKPQETELLLNRLAESLVDDVADSVLDKINTGRLTIKEEETPRKSGRKHKSKEEKTREKQDEEQQEQEQEEEGQSGRKHRRHRRRHHDEHQSETETIEPAAVPEPEPVSAEKSPVRKPEKKLDNPHAEAARAKQELLRRNQHIRDVFVRAQDVSRRLDHGEIIDMDTIDEDVRKEVERIRSVNSKVVELGKDKSAREKRLAEEEEKKRLEMKTEMEKAEEERRRLVAEKEEMRVAELLAKKNAREEEAKRRKATIEILKMEEARRNRERREKGEEPIHKRLEEEYVKTHVMAEEQKRKETLKKIHEAYASVSKEEIDRHQAEMERKKAAILAKKEADRLALREEAKAVKQQLDHLYRSKLLDSALKEDEAKKSEFVKQSLEAKLAAERKKQYASKVMQRNHTKLAPLPAKSLATTEANDTTASSSLAPPNNDESAVKKEENILKDPPQIDQKKKPQSIPSQQSNPQQQNHQQKKTNPNSVKLKPLTSK